MPWNLLLIKVLNDFWYFKHQILTRICSEAYLKRYWRNCLCKLYFFHSSKTNIQLCLKHGFEQIIVEVWGLKYHKIFKTMIRSRFQGVYITSFQQTVMCVWGWGGSDGEWLAHPVPSLKSTYMYFWIFRWDLCWSYRLLVGGHIICWILTWRFFTTSKRDCQLLHQKVRQKISVIKTKLFCGCLQDKMWIKMPKWTFFLNIITSVCFDYWDFLTNLLT